MSDRAPRPETKDWTKTSLGKRVDHVCQLRGWSLNKLGEEAGLASGVMSRLARREATVAGAPDTLAKVADAGGVNVLWLMLGRGPVERVEHRPGLLRTHPDWPAALAEAKKWQRGIPDEFWELAGDAAFPAPPRLDWQLIVGLVRELYSAHQRWQEESARRGSTPPPAGPESAPGTTKARSGAKKR
ncbi:MAG: helix-turn-helix transcriptional regulator [Minicystis sp.]